MQCWLIRVTKKYFVLFLQFATLTLMSWERHYLSVQRQLQWRPRSGFILGLSNQSVPLTVYSQTNEFGEVAVGLTCVNTHSLLSHKDSHNTGHMIRNLSKNDTGELGEQDDEMSAVQTDGHLESGYNKMVFTVQVLEWLSLEIVWWGWLYVFYWVRVRMTWWGLSFKVGDWLSCWVSK